MTRQILTVYPERQVRITAREDGPTMGIERTVCCLSAFVAPGEALYMAMQAAVRLLRIEQLLVLALLFMLAACAPKPLTPLAEWQKVDVTGPPDHYSVCMDDPPPATVEACSGWRTVYLGGVR